MKLIRKFSAKKTWFYSVFKTTVNYFSKLGNKRSCKASNNRRIKFNIKKSHQNISGGIFGGEPINFD